MMFTKIYICSTMLVALAMIRFAAADPPQPTSGSLDVETMPDTTMLEFPSDPATGDCSELLELQLACRQGHCAVNRDNHDICHSMLYQYHGGPCGSSSSISSPLAACQDFDHHHNSAAASELYLTMTALGDSKTVYYEGNVQVGDYIKIADHQHGLGDYYNVTVYSSNDTGFDTMLQTMILYSPCEEEEIAVPDYYHSTSFQLVGTAMDRDEHRHVDLELLLTSTGFVSYMVDSLSLASTIEPTYSNLTDRLEGHVVDAGEMLRVSYAMPIQDDAAKAGSALTVLATIGVTTEYGTQCYIHGLLEEAIVST